MKKIVNLIASLLLMTTVLFQLSPNRKVTAQEEVLKVAIVQLTSHPSLDQIVSGIYDGLESEGYIEDDNLQVDFHNAQGDINLLSNISDTVINNEPALIFAVTTPVAQAFQHATADIPIIMVGVTDPVAASLVESMEEPEANITGVSDAIPVEQQVELILQVLPDIQSLGMIYTTSEDNSLAEIEEVSEVAESLGIEVIAEGITTSLDMPLVAENLVGQVDAVYIGSDNTVASAFGTLLDVTDAAGKAVFPSVYEMIEQGGLAGVTINQKDVGLQAATMAVKILDGQAIADTPVEYVDTLRRVYNQEVIDRLGLEFSSEQLAGLENIIEE